MVKKLTEATVAVVNHEISSEGSGGEVIHTAGPIRHVPHHNGISLCKPGMYIHKQDVISLA